MEMHASVERESRKGRAKGGIITAVNKELKEIESREWSKQVVQRKIEYNEDEWRIITVYSQNVQETLW